MSGIAARMATTESRTLRPDFVYFGPDAAETGTRRRLAQIRQVGARVVGFTFRRHNYHQTFVPDWENVSFGVIPAGRYGRRLGALARALLSVLRRPGLPKPAIIVARNLDLLAIALAARMLGRLKGPVVYEVLDIRGVLLGASPIAVLLRFAERQLLRHCDALIVSSPGFATRYFRPIQGYRRPIILVENRLNPAALAASRQPEGDWLSRGRTKREVDLSHLVVGWVGAFRCARSAALLAGLARRLPQIRILLAGVPTYCDHETFRRTFDGLSNVTFHGEFPYPRGLYDVYAQIDLNWGFDLSKRGGSGRWLLPNRLYEGGFFGVPMLTESDSETAAYVERLGIGWAVAPDEDALVDLIVRRLPSDYPAVKAAAVAAMDTEFTDNDDLQAVVTVLSGKGGLPTEIRAA